MLALALLCSLVLGLLAGPVIQEQAGSEMDSVYYGVDLSAPLPTSTFQCIRKSSYNYAFVRIYSPAGQGQLDPNGCNNIRNAFAAGLITDSYMTPVPKSGKTGSQQFDEMFGGLRNCAISVNSFWVQVTSQVDWYSSTSKNIAFLNSLIGRAWEYGISVGVYTSAYEWNQIMGGAATNNLQLWYWNNNGAGAANESPANFNDFRSFGSWTTPSAKQFGQAESVCGVTVNRDIISVSNTAKSVEMARHEKSEQVVVGILGFGNIALGKPEIRQ